MKISIIAAVALNGVIGNCNEIPWYIPEDLKHFKKITLGHHVLMGTSTYWSIIKALGKPLPGRTSLVLTRNANLEAPGCDKVYSFPHAREFAKAQGERELMVIGGASIYKLAMPETDCMYITEVNLLPKGDIFFPHVNLSDWNHQTSELLTSKVNRFLGFKYCTLTRISKGE